MGASSVTGVSGPGSVMGKQKGSDHMSLGVDKLVGTRVVAAGRVTLASGVATVTFPKPLSGSQSNYVVIPHAYNSTTVARATALTDDASSNFTSFALAGGTTDVVHYIVVKI